MTLNLYAITEEEVKELKAYLAKICPEEVANHRGINNTIEGLWVQLVDNRVRSWQPAASVIAYENYFSNHSKACNNIHIYAYLYPEQYPELLL